MLDISQLDAFYEHISQHSEELFPDGIARISLRTLRDMKLLSEETRSGGQPAHLLHAVQSPGRITLFNERFVLWIVPEHEAEPPSTTVYMARKEKEEIKPEMAFRTHGIHNRSRTILRLIDSYMADIQETQGIIARLEEQSSA